MQVQTFTGQLYDLRAPAWGHVSLVDVAHALGHICRFTGATRAHYSVAQHSVVCSYLTPPEYALHALLHDTPEAYVGDRSAPAASVHAWARGFGTEHPWADPHQQLHERAEIAIYYHLGVRLPDHQARAAVKAADYTALRHEATVHLMGGPAIEQPPFGDGEPWCEPLCIEPSTLIHPCLSNEANPHRPHKGNLNMAEQLLYGSLPADTARYYFLLRLLELAQGPQGNGQLYQLAYDAYNRPKPEAMSYRKLRQAWAHLDHEDPDDYPGAIH